MPECIDRVLLRSFFGFSGAQVMPKVTNDAQLFSSYSAIFGIARWARSTADGMVDRYRTIMITRRYPLN